MRPTSGGDGSSRLAAHPWLRGLSPSTILDLAVMYSGFAIRTLAPVALIPLLGRVLGPDNYGLIVIASTVTMWSWQITESGLPTTASREIATIPGERTGSIASASIAARIVMAVPALAVAIPMILLSQPLRDALLLSGLSVLLGLQSAFNLGWLFMAIGQRRLLSAAETLPPVLTLLLCFLFVTDKDHAVRTLVVMNVSTFLTNALFLVIASRLIELRVPAFSAVWREVTGSLQFLTLRVSQILNQTLSVYLLGLLTTSAQVAHYSVAEKIVSAAAAMFGPIYQMMFPLTMKQLVDPESVAPLIKRISLFVLLLSIIGSAILWTSSYKMLALVMGPQYADSSVFVRWLAWTIPLGVACQLLVFCVLMPLRKDRVIIALTVMLTAFGTLLAVALAWRYDAMGMVAARILSTLAGVAVWGVASWKAARSGLGATTLSQTGREARR